MKNNLHRQGKIWYCLFRVDGKRYNPSLKTTNYETAKIKAIQVMAEKRGIKSDAEVGWHGFKGEYFKERKPLRKKTTTDFDRQSFDLLESEFPISKLTDLTPKLLGSFQSRLKSQKKSNVNTNKLISVIITAMKKAEDWELIQPQKWNKVERLPEPKGKLRYYTVYECTVIKQSLNGVWLTIALLGIRAGLRREEMHTLRWEMVDLKHGMIRIEAFGDWMPKDHESRAIPIAPDLKKHLGSIARPTGYILGEDRPALDTMTHRFSKLIKKAGILNSSLHTTRHTFGSHLAMAGVSPRKIQEVMGHADLKTTQIYMHLSPQSIKDSVDQLPEF